ncbi:MAG TPA: hypothetical protein VHV53_02330 [Solirubrobacterales bacterium]|jgi:hypothetical protein|nr:hypothetical protein [Solirubrobacterales bacterium]
MEAETETMTDGGVAGNARLTAAVAVALLVLLAAEGATIPFIGRLLGPHIFLGMLLVPPVMMKLGSTGYRFARYYSHSPAYVRRGPPHLALRSLAPGVVLTTIALFGTGVALLVQGPPSNTLRFAHKLSFIAWVALISLHVLGHLLELPRLALADWRRGEEAIGGAGARTAALAAALLTGIAVALLTLPLASAWLAD